MQNINFDTIFTEDVLNELFPDNRSDRFFDALYGDAAEGAYDIHLKFEGYSGNQLQFAFHLSQRPDKCLACNLTYGLPDVFSRHPIIDIKGLAGRIDQLLNGQGKCVDWQMGRTREISATLHIIPLTFFLDS